MTACAEGSPELVRELLVLKANVEHKDINNRNCLFYIPENKKKNSYMTLSLILDEYPQLVNSTASNNRNLLMAAIEKYKPDLVKVLLERGADPNQPLGDSRNQCPIRSRYASAHRSQEHEEAAR